MDTDSDLSPGSVRRHSPSRAASDGSISEEEPEEAAEDVASVATEDAPSEEEGAAAPLDAAAIESFLAGAQVSEAESLYGYGISLSGLVFRVRVRLAIA